ncbi:MAG: hypothetical protein GON13_02135 [Nanoarchaeota archaeon]|nr:hypothetical protein [Nanoarchaeota archaeon]
MMNNLKIFLIAFLLTTTITTLIILNLNKEESCDCQSWTRVCFNANKTINIVHKPLTHSFGYETVWERVFVSCSKPHGFETYWCEDEDFSVGLYVGVREVEEYFQELKKI